MVTSVVKVTRRGQTTIPRRLREKYSIKEGDDLIVEDADGEIVLKRVPKLETLAGIDAGFGSVSEVKKEVEKMRDSY